MTRDHLPDYDGLPEGPIGGRLGWGLFGDGDELGMLNLQTDARRAEAAGLVRTGRMFRLDMPLGAINPPLNPRRGVLRHRVIAQPNIGFDDAIDNLYPQAGSQWDSLAHIGYTREHYYNGVSPREVVERGANAITAIAARGIAGRAVLLDLESVMLRRIPDYSPAARVAITVDMLEEARVRAGITFQPGDTVLLCTGFTAWYARQPTAVREKLPGNVVTAGLDQSEAVARYLWNSRIAAIAADNFAVEAWPADTSVEGQPWSFLHQILIGSFGMALGELWWLDDLVEDCRSDGVYEGLLMSAPLYLEGGIGSPANAVFLK